ncbi:MAG: anhydro-N-acetylmuramic acid kinase [Arenimonas sp.]|nr:anhydro-N-acetylmuramic acid kinase [Arenimonas sp.]
MHSSLYIGLMSGTSLDGIDVALVDFKSGASLLHAGRFALPETLRHTLLQLSQSNYAISLEQVGQLETALGQAFADAVRQFCQQNIIARKHVRAIGSHGQTLRHNPNGNLPYTLQMGDANIIAEQTGIATVADFRRRDVAAGGQGAPLVPAFHQALFAKPDYTRAIVNIGGIANITLLPTNGKVTGFDTGPGNGLMDAWCQKQWQISYDNNGQKSSQGEIDHDLLERLMADPWLQLPAPKSTGRDVFNLDWLDVFLQHRTIMPENVLCTLNAFTAQTISDALLATSPTIDEIFVCGGGVHNAILMQNLQRLCPCPVLSTATLGVDPDYVEAMAFAWLAKQCIEGKPGNVVEVTGAKGSRILGAIYQA